MKSPASQRATGASASTTGGVRPATGAAHGRDPIFVHGIYPRSGTNYLMNLLCLHPDCAAPEPIWEDGLLTHVRHLDAYVDAVSEGWDPSWGVDDGHPGRLRESLGHGLSLFLHGLSRAPRVVTKTPRVEGLARMPLLLPEAILLVLIRDGRAVVESGVRSFGWYRDGAIHAWRDAGRAILEFDAAFRGGSFRYRIVRYEDLASQPEKSMREILEFVGLDPDRYAFDRVRSLPVRGSSDLADSPASRMDWDGRPATSDFDPLGRSKGWSRWQRARFEWVAGDTARALGYDSGAPGDRAAAHLVWNRLLDLRHRAIATAASLRRVWRRWRAAIEVRASTGST